MSNIFTIKKIPLEIRKPLKEFIEGYARANEHMGDNIYHSQSVLNEAPRDFNEWSQVQAEKDLLNQVLDPVNFAMASVDFFQPYKNLYDTYTRVLKNYQITNPESVIELLKLMIDINWAYVRWCDALFINIATQLDKYLAIEKDPKLKKLATAAKTTVFKKCENVGKQPKIAAIKKCEEYIKKVSEYL